MSAHHPCLSPCHAKTQKRPSHSCCVSVVHFIASSSESARAHAAHVAWAPLLRFLCSEALGDGSPTSELRHRRRRCLSLPPMEPQVSHRGCLCAGQAHSGWVSALGRAQYSRKQSASLTSPTCAFAARRVYRRTAPVRAVSRRRGENVSRRRRKNRSSTGKHSSSRATTSRWRPRRRRACDWHRRLCHRWRGAYAAAAGRSAVQRYTRREHTVLHRDRGSDAGRAGCESAPHV
jgi:hypothetical protein